jgi:predicted nucleic acid-binding protein
MATMGDKALFVDTNILVYANVIETPFHEQALAAINAAHQGNRAIWINRQVIREYLVTLTRPQAFDNLPKEIVLEQVKQFIKKLEVADDTPNVSEKLLELLADFKVGGKQIHDTNIVATMLAYNIPCLLTHNIKDFKRFEGVVEIESI